MNKHDRGALWRKIKDEPAITVVVIGAGVNGISAYRELALQGVDVLLVDKGDFCSGASAAPSRMIHGGLRYLETGEADLVRESLKERNLLLQNAPHYIRPLPTTIPIFYWAAGVMPAIRRFLGIDAKPARRGAAIIKIGLWFYDFFTRYQQVLPRHRFHSRNTTRERWPELNPALVCSATYFDAWVSDPERLALEMVLDTQQQASSSTALNYVSVHSGATDGLTLRNEITGEEAEVRPTVVINATGAWIDFTNAALENKTTFIGGTKGSHLVIDNKALLKATGGHMIFYENPDGRVCVLFPFKGKVLVGSTDLPVDRPDDVKCTPEERAYILDSLAYVFPDIQIDPEQILYTFSGVRPLPRSDAQVTGEISRNHQCHVTPPSAQHRFPIYSMVGGKWTTFRAFGEQVAEKVLSELNKPHHIRTENLAIGGGVDYPNGPAAMARLQSTITGTTGLAETRVSVLLERYGTRARIVAEFLVAYPDQPMSSLADYSEREILFLIENEWVMRLTDLVLRRTSLAISGQLNAARLIELNQLLGKAHGWTSQRCTQELESTIDYLVQFHDLSWDQLSRVEQPHTRTA